MKKTLLLRSESYLSYLTNNLRISINNLDSLLNMIIMNRYAAY